jgi:NADH-quinone oxidoreductase subunit N
MAGVPPFVGFWAKLRIVEVLWESHHMGLLLLALATSVIGAFYYLRVVILMYFDQPEGEAIRGNAGTGVRLALVVNALAVLVLGVLPDALIDLCARLIH